MSQTQEKTATGLPPPVPASAKPLDLDPAEFREKFDRRHFEVGHHLADHPAFALPRLIGLARDIAATRPKDLYYDVGDIGIGQRWDTTQHGLLPIDETIRRIETSGAWIILWRADLDPAYGELLNGVMDQVLDLAGPAVARMVKKKEVILFITSPNRTTSYHIDRECNFLLQIQGDKQANIFRAEDRDVLPEREIELFWTVDNNAPCYRPEFQDHAAVYDLRPGNGVHIPVNSPHWLKNGNNISVSVSFNFQFHDSRRANLYRANHFLRKLHLNPTPPFRSPLRDAIKQPVGAALYKARQILRGPGPRD